MDKINIGDDVVVEWDGGDIFRGAVVYVPQATGDMWYVKNDKALMAINPSSSRLISITRPSGKEE